MSACLMFAQGQTATLVAQFVTTDGQPVDVPDATVEVFGPGGSVTLAATPMINVITGFYYYDWAIPNSLPVTTYTVRYTGTVLGVPTAAIDSLSVVTPGTPTTITQRTVDLVAALETYICCAQHIPVYHELGRRTGATRDSFSFSWPRWSLANHIIKQNDEILIPSQYTIDTETGILTFPTPLHSTDRIFATYNFRYFSTPDMIRFLSDALSQINLESPGTNFTLETVPDSYVGVLMMGATKNAIKKLLFCLNFQQTKTIFGGPEGAKEALSNLNTLKENNEKEFAADKKQIKRARYPSIAMVSSPEFSMPGGRCFLENTKVYISFNGNTLYEKIKDVYKKFQAGNLIKVLGQNENGDKVFSNVSKIWKSGLKESNKISTINHNVETSSEHLFFVKGRGYIPLMDIKIGEELTCLSSNGTLSSEKIISIEKTGRMEEMYDMEVPEIQNFFANGIKTHNSRWFRYLFSGGGG